MFSEKAIPEEIINMITGKMLGDGCITKQTGRKPRFQFIHSIKDKEWCFFCYQNLATTIQLTQPFYKKVLDNRTKKGYTECYQVQSRTDPFITVLEQIWYCNRRKRIPFDFLEKYLNELALAWWYQDDGHLSIKNHTPKKIILSTDNFTTAENIDLITLLAQKFHLNFKLDAQNRIILYDKLQIHYFIKLVQPYIHASMNRKLLPNYHTNNVGKRTTIYLPKHIHLIKPTQEINQQLHKLNQIKNIVLDRTNYIQFYKSELYSYQQKQETSGYQIVIQEEYYSSIQIIKSQTGLTTSQIVTLCFNTQK